MNLYELASQDEAWGAYALDDDTTPLSAWPADPPAPLPPGPVPLDAALDAAAREYGVDADVLRALARRLGRFHFRHRSLAALAPGGL